MRNEKLARLQKVKQILRTMDCEIELDYDSGIWVDGGLWHISMPENEPSTVYLGIIPKVSGNTIVDVAVRFSVTATLMGLEVVPEGTIPADSTSPAGAWVELINNK